jgi:hypothetical protein
VGGDAGHGQVVAAPAKNCDLDEQPVGLVEDVSADGGRRLRAPQIPQ